MEAKIPKRNMPVTFKIDGVELRDHIKEYIVVYDRDELIREESLLAASQIYSREELCCMAVKKNSEKLGRILDLTVNSARKLTSVTIAKTEDFDWLARTFNLMRGQRDGNAVRKLVAEVRLDLIV